LYDENKDRLRPAEDGFDGSWLARFLSEFGRICGIDMKEPYTNKIFRWVQADASFDQEQTKAYFCPINWDGQGQENGAKIGQLMADNITLFVESLKPALLVSGLSSDAVGDLVRKGHAEVEDPTRLIYSSWIVSWAFKAT